MGVVVVAALEGGEEGASPGGESGFCVLEGERVDDMSAVTFENQPWGSFPHFVREEKEGEERKGEKNTSRAIGMRVQGGAVHALRGDLDMLALHVVGNAALSSVRGSRGSIRDCVEKYGEQSGAGSFKG